MKLKKGSFSDFAQRVKSTGKKVVVYGAGMIGRTIAPYWLHEFGLDSEVLCYVDADPGKQGKTVELAGRAVPIEALGVFDKLDGPMILVTVSAFEPVVSALEKIPALDEAEIYFLPVMLIERAHSIKSDGVVRTSEKQLIPKTIHYCWFSGNPIPDTLKRCMDTWEKFCPDYEIVRWDESNYDISWSPYMVQAYEHKKWGFVSDVARFDILYRHGGIYLDTDVELIRNLDDLLYQRAFCGVEKWGDIGSGASIGAQRYNSVIKAMLDFRKDYLFLSSEGKIEEVTSGGIDTPALMQFGMSINGETETIADGAMTVYSSDFFLPFDYISGETHITENTFSVHHFSGSWMGEDAALERQHTREKYQEFLNRLEE